MRDRALGKPCSLCADHPRTYLANSTLATLGAHLKNVFSAEQTPRLSGASPGRPVGGRPRPGCAAHDRPPAPRGTMPRVACVGCGAEFPCAPSFRGRAPKCSACRPDATAAAKSAPQNGAAGAPQPSHMTPCACHCAACRAAGHGDGACVVLCAGLHTLFDGKADVVDLVLRHYYGACGWGTARFDAGIRCVQYRPGLGDVIAAGADDGRIHFICAQTGEKILSRLKVDGEVWSVDWSPCGTMIAAACNEEEEEEDYCVKILNSETGALLCDLNVGSWVNSVQFSPSGDTVAAGCGNGTVQIIDVATAEVKRPLSGEKPINCVAFSPDGSLIAAGAGHYGFGSGEVRIYNASTGDPVGSPLRGHRYAPSLSKECFLSFR